MNLSAVHPKPAPNVNHNLNLDLNPSSFLPHEPNPNGSGDLGRAPAWPPLTALNQHLRHWGCWAVLFLSLFWAQADDLTQGFEAANRLYAEGKYAEAVASYQKLIRSRGVSTALYYNLGNACYKAGQIGQAIGYYRLALELEPRDPDLKANLQFARNRANAGFAASTSRWHAFLGQLTLDEWTLLAAALGWVWVTMLTLRQWRDSLKNGLAGYTFTAGLVWVLAVAVLIGKARAELGVTPAVVITRQATVRYGPLEESRSFFTLPDGAEIEVVDRQGDWLQVRDTARRTGWLRQHQVMILRLPA